MCGWICDYNWDCRDSEACKWFEEGRACGTMGSGQNGDACTSFADCGGSRTCINLVNGYCARAGCTSNADCESNTKCIPWGDTGACLRDCSSGSDVCRLAEGYTCEPMDDMGDVEQQVCFQTYI